MRASAWLLASLLGCTGGEGADPAAEVPASSATVDPLQAAFGAEAAWEAAWWVEDGAVVPRSGGTVLARGGGTAQGEGAPCGDAVWIEVEEPPVLWLPGEAPATRPAPANTAALVERAAWRLHEALGDEGGLVPGGADRADPALYKGVRVRSVRKTRRSGPPILVMVGDRGPRVAVAISDRAGEQVLASDVVDLDATFSEVGALAVQDLDGDGTEELVVYAEDGPGRQAMRLAWTVDLSADPPLALRWARRSAGAQCP